MMLSGRDLLCACGTCGRAPPTAIEADTACAASPWNMTAVRIVDDMRINVVHAAVIKEMAVMPVAAIISHSGISETVVDSTVESDVRTPVARIPDICTTDPAPVTRGPQKARLGRHHPSTRYPEIAVSAVGPVTRHPNVIRSRTNRLHIYGQGRWSNRDRDSHSHGGVGGDRQDSQSERK